ncbi:hypothetical protein N180_18590 [Pedobacter antarcticus 4BY]|uniref:Lipoprotein n=2 Tax=Pedobacter antarcticus TaxID=34086 RepID=A0A081PJF1_9SPHI|nr:hypothetical protein [Pedobacter antarcticus]KEQ30824.1 hypothetical protein N180_18590 [Pedobacter antarcticus 4BY]SFE66945.1 hypothetical protein SAMN03003324_01039 [Pedobacter antarcticus]
MNTLATKSYLKLPIFSLLMLCVLLLNSCAETPDKFFGVAVLNTNIVTDFATPRLAKHISDTTTEYPDIPSSKKNGDEAVSYLGNKILYMEKVVKDIKGLTENSSTKEIIKESLDLYAYVLPVYKNEYMAYAKLCDAKGSKEEKEAMSRKIEDKYAETFETKYISLMEKGKAYADKHNLNVKWD